MFSTRKFGELLIYSFQYTCTLYNYIMRYIYTIVILKFITGSCGSSTAIVVAVMVSVLVVALVVAAIVIIVVICKLILFYCDL